MEGIRKGDTFSVKNAIYTKGWRAWTSRRSLPLYNFVEHPPAPLTLTHRLCIPFQGHVYRSSVGACHHPSTPRKTVLQNICNLARKHAPHTLWPSIACSTNLFVIWGWRKACSRLDHQIYLGSSQLQGFEADLAVSSWHRRLDCDHSCFLPTPSGDSPTTFSLVLCTSSC